MADICRSASSAGLVGLTGANTSTTTSTTTIPTADQVREAAVFAPRFKYQFNASMDDLEAIRRLINDERNQQVDEAELKFWTPDYERMMLDDWLVTRFLLRGRKMSQRLNKELHSKETVYASTLNLIQACAKFRQSYSINALTEVDEFPAEWIEKNGLLHHKHDLAGNPVMYMRIKLHKPKLIQTPESRHQFKRLLLYTLERCDRDLINKPGAGLCCLFDMTNATYENIDLELLKWMIKSFKSYSPKLLCYIIVYNLPWFFSTTFKLISNTLLSTSNKQSIKFVYGNEIFRYISRENLPSYLAKSIEVSFGV